jgi:glycerate-2-kinase
MIRIRNKGQLVKNGEGPRERRARAIALQSLESAIHAVDPRRIMRARVRLKGASIQVDGHSFDLKRFKDIYVVGGGKASGSMAAALSKILSHRITGGLVNVPQGDMHRAGVIKMREASHPIPNEAGVKGAREMLEIAERAGKDALVICLISGGGSSLMPLPRGEISLSNKREITESLLKSGATISEINTVRKHISDFKGGWLAKKANPATILNLILSDVVGDPIEFIASGPTVPDSTTFRDAINVLKRYRLWDSTPETITTLLSKGAKGLVPETPKPSDNAFRKVHNIVLGNNRTASLAARKRLESSSLHALLLTSTLEGEARNVGGMLASIAREISISGHPVPRPAGIVAGGETTVSVIGSGKGGRNQEIALAAGRKLGFTRGVAVASLSTDGVDGPTDAAGALADGHTLGRALKKGLSADSFLARNDSYAFFSNLGDLIFTGPTGTNVNDITVVVVL